MKKCSVCFKEKPLEDFYKDAKKKDGHTSDCKECRKARSRERDRMLRESDPDFEEKERVRARDRYKRLYTGRAQNPKTAKAARKRYAEKYPEKKQAQSALNAAKRRLGKNVFPSGFEYHHFSYLPKYWLVVFMLTKLEHIKIHRFIEYDEESFGYFLKDNPDAGIMNLEDHTSFITEILGRKPKILNLSGQ